MNIMKDCIGVKSADEISCGAEKAKALIVAIEANVQKQQESGADFKTEEIATMIENSFNFTTDFQRGMALAFADFLGSTMEGCPPSLDSWMPLSRISKE